jgi:hypothetical protein
VTAAQIFACIIAATAVMVAVTVYVLVRRRRSRREPVEWAFDGGEITFDRALTEEQVEEFKARWLKLHGNNRTAHHVSVLHPASEEEPS